MTEKCVANVDALYEAFVCVSFFTSNCYRRHFTWPKSSDLFCRSTIQHTLCGFGEKWCEPNVHHTEVDCVFLFFGLFFFLKILSQLAAHVICNWYVRHLRCSTSRLIQSSDYLTWWVRGVTSACWLQTPPKPLYSENMKRWQNRVLIPF